MEVPVGTKHSEVVLFSGGWDSTLCALMYPKADLVFFDYGQTYEAIEFSTANKIANELNRRFKFKSIHLGHDAKNRNFKLIMALHNEGYEKIIIGSRNLLPIFDKYKDSNWLSLKMFSWLLRIKIIMPITGYTKKRIVDLVRGKTLTIPYNCYKTNATDCDCVNCVEMRKIL